MAEKEKTTATEIIVSPAPHIRMGYSTRGVMLDVIIALLPAVAAAVFYFRWRAAVLVLACMLSAVVTEWLCNLIRRRQHCAESLGDLSAALTGLILALSLPPALPVWAAVIGSCFAVAVGKMVFGGLGANVFNPAMVGRTFLAASFGVLMTTWTVPASIDPSLPAVSAAQGVDAVTRATILAHSKEAIKAHDGAGQVRSILAAGFTGQEGGCLGETCVPALLVGAIYLLIRGTISWHIPAGVLASSWIFAAVAQLIDHQAYVSPLIHLTGGGLVLCAFFIATDPVTAPLTVKGMWIFAVGVGAVTMLIRVLGEYPEGIMFAVLLMNAVTPLIDRFLSPVPAGGRPHA